MKPTRLPLAVIGACLVAGCAGQPAVVGEAARSFEGPMPADFSGSWQRDYARGDEADQAFRDAYYELYRYIPDRPAYPGAPGPTAPSSKDREALLAVARLAELITRPDELTIVQDDVEILIQRDDDFAMLCAFFDGVAKPTASGYGTEICGWDGSDLVSNLILPDGLQVVHRLTISADRSQLRVITTVASTTAKVPVTIRRFYTRFQRPSSGFNCIETLSMKRVCSTGELEP